MIEDPRVRSDDEERLLGRDPEADRAARKAALEEAELEAVYITQVIYGACVPGAARKRSLNWNRLLY